MGLKAKNRFRSALAGLPPAMRRALAGGLCLAAAAAPASAGPRVWQDGMTGLAIGGYDPLAYYTQGAPHRGRDDFELTWGGAVWRFLSSGNRAAFERNPGVYAPRFAGYDPYAIANGRTTPGEPSIWVRQGDSIYLFFDAANKRLWMENRQALTAQAEGKWTAGLADTLPHSLGE